MSVEDHVCVQKTLRIGSKLYSISTFLNPVSQALVIPSYTVSVTSPTLGQNPVPPFKGGEVDFPSRYTEHSV